MILGNVQFFGVKLFGGLIVESAVCLQTGKLYSKEQAQKFYHLYKIYAWSYKTIVAVKENGKVTLDSKALEYSNTTLNFI